MGPKVRMKFSPFSRQTIGPYPALPEGEGRHDSDLGGHLVTRGRISGHSLSPVVVQSSLIQRHYPAIKMH